MCKCPAPRRILAGGMDIVNKEESGHNEAEEVEMETYKWRGNGTVGQCKGIDF